MTAYSLRLASEPEQDRIFDAYRSTVGPYITEAWGWDDSFQTNSFWTHHPLSEFQVIEVRNHFAGGLHLEEAEHDIFIRMIFLLPEFQNSGIGSQLISEIHRSARSRGKALSLKVVHCNPAKHLYERLGFVVTCQDDSSRDLRWV